MPRTSPASLALALSGTLGLFATATCGGAPAEPAVAPAPPPPAAAPAEPAEKPDAGTSAWSLPSVPLAAPRTTVFLAPPPVGPDAGALRPIPADPAPILAQGQWVYDLRFERGEVFLAGVHPVQLAAPRETPRVMGRFALEIYSGPTLVERVRFDFPGLGSPEPTPDAGPRPLHGVSFSFTAKLTTRVGVMVPATPRGNRLELWDRATDRRWPLPWPPVEMTGALPGTGAGDPAAATPAESAVAPAGSLLPVAPVAAQRVGDAGPASQ